MNILLLHQASHSTVQISRRSKKKKEKERKEMRKK
jgi:hypothetical protein